MRIECAVLCDAASVREGLLHVLGAGISNTTFGEFPSRLPMTFAFRVVLEPRELRPRHALSIRLVDPVGDAVYGRLQLTFEVEDPAAAREESALATPVPLGAFEVPGPGRYLIEADFDKQRVGTFPLRILKAEPHGRDEDDDEAVEAGT
jgi:hypothetical protein